jgi:16S rRNA (cytidine1402-2'-O)-methyltransferase
MQPTEFRAQAGHLYVVATPIGNLRDITLRALDILKSVDVVAAEDTRVSAGLLAAFGIEARLVSCRAHNEKQAALGLLERLRAGASVAYVSDAGTPGISDPGSLLVRAAREAGVAVEPIPGPSAVTTVLSVAGLDAGQWLFQGFLPARSGPRRAALQALRALPCALVFYEAPHRLDETLADMLAILGGERRLVLARELTKRFESVHTCRLDAADAWLAGDPDRRRGEFVLIVDAPTAVDDAGWQEALRCLAILLDELPASQAARLAARISGQKKKALYDQALKAVTRDE